MNMPDVRFIEHIVEPKHLLLIWQSPNEDDRHRHIVAELNREEDNATLTYLVSTDDFQQALQKGFSGYPAFQDFEITHTNVLDAFMCRLPPRSRADFPQYLQGLRVKPDAKLSDFALLGYSGAKLPSDSFSIINPFENGNLPCELLIEAAGFRHIKKKNEIEVQVGDEVKFVIQNVNETTQKPAVQLFVNQQLIGYVTRALIPTVTQWINTHRVAGAWIEKINGSPEKPARYIYLRVLPVS